MIFLGFALAYCYRLSLNINGSPEILTWFCIVASSIGIAEEACFRGYVQSVIRKYEPWTACFLAALTHTAYKTALFTFPESAYNPDLPMLFFCTFAVGLILAALRETLGSILFPVLFHATFDVIAYGDLSRAPWWVWSGV